MCTFLPIFQGAPQEIGARARIDGLKMAYVTASNYKSDRLYPRVREAMNTLLTQTNVVSPLQVFQKLELLNADEIVDWKHAKVPYLEQVIKCNLSKASRILRLMRFHAHDLNLKPSMTIYKKKSAFLRFTKTGEPKIEEAYSRCYVKQVAVVRPNSPYISSTEM